MVSSPGRQLTKRPISWLPLRQPSLPLIVNTAASRAPPRVKRRCHVHLRGTERTSCIRGSLHALSALDLVLTAAGGIRPAAPSTYDRGVVTERAKSIEELAERMRVATRPTDDDV